MSRPSVDGLQKEHSSDRRLGQIAERVAISVILDYSTRLYLKLLPLLSDFDFARSVVFAFSVLGS